MAKNRFINVDRIDSTLLSNGVASGGIKRAILIPVIAAKQAKAILEGKNDNKQELIFSVPDVDTPDAMSLYGTPIYGLMDIEQPKHTKFIVDRISGEYTEESVVLPDGNRVIGEGSSAKHFLRIEGCVLEVSQNRNIVTTSISGQDGTDKEYINNGDFQVKMEGFLSTDTPDVYPEAEVKALRAYLDAPIPLSIDNTFLNDYFGITSLVVMKYKMQQVRGMRNVQFFTVDFISDFSFEVSLSEPVLGDQTNDFSDVA
jgi:hypothetical protein